MMKLFKFRSLCINIPEASMNTTSTPLTSTNWKPLEINPEVSFFHFGDIDAGGFYIFEHLRQQTGVDFKPYHMDRETLLQYRRYTKKLTENDRKRLKKLVCGRFKDVIDYMLEHDCKLEQEAIDWNSQTE